MFFGIASDAGTIFDLFVTILLRRNKTTGKTTFSPLFAARTGTALQLCHPSHTA
jgi:hypothetical protein